MKHYQAEYYITGNERIGFRAYCPGCHKRKTVENIPQKLICTQCGATWNAVPKEEG